MSDQWYYQAFGQEFGPLAEEEVARMLASGELTADDSVRQGSAGEWTRAGSVAGLMERVTAVAVETAEVATDIDSFMLVDEQEVVAFETSDDAARSDSLNTATADDDYELDDDASSTAADEEPSVWYFQTFGTELGPVSLSELSKLVQRGELSASDAVRMGTAGDWITAEEVPSLFPKGRTSSATTGRASSTGYGSTTRQPAAPATTNRQATSPAVTKPAAGSDWNTPQRPASAAAPAAWTAPAADVDVNWYCFVDEQEYGPFGITDLQGMAVSGRVLPETYVKYGPQGEWVLASQVPNLIPSTEPVPATPSQVVFVPVAPAAAPISLADSERNELVQQLLTLLKKEGLQTSLLGSISTAAPTTGAGWYCNISGSVMGPVSIEALVQMVLQKRIFPDDLIRLGDSGEWFPAKTVPDLFPDGSAGKGKKNKLDDDLNVMERIDKMYREAQEAKAKQEAANAANPKATKSEPSRSRAADNMLHEMSAKLARGKSEAELAAERAEKWEQFMGGLKLDGRSISILAVIGVCVLGYFLAPILLADFFAGQSYDKLMAVNKAVMADVEKGIDGAAWEKKTKELQKTVTEISKSVRGGKPKSAKRDVASMANYMKEMLRNVGRHSKGSTEDDFSRAQKLFEGAMKKAKKTLGR